jgi:hypothetical protein
MVCIEANANHVPFAATADPMAHSGQRAWNRSHIQARITNHWIAWSTAPCGNFNTPLGGQTSGGLPSVKFMNPRFVMVNPRAHEIARNINPHRMANRMAGESPDQAFLCHARIVSRKTTKEANTIDHHMSVSMTESHVVKRLKWLARPRHA